MEIPFEISLERCAAAITRSNLFGIFLTQSSTVTRAIVIILQVNVELNK